MTVQLSPSLPPCPAAIPNAQLQSLLGGAGGRMDQQQLMELLGGAGGFPHALANMGRGGGASDTPRYAGIATKPLTSVISRSNGRGASQSAHTPASSAPSSTAPQAPVQYVGYLLYSVAATIDSLGNQSTEKLNPSMTAEHISTRQIIQDQFCQMRTYVHIGHA